MLDVPFPLNASLLFVQDPPELGEEAVFNLLNMESFPIINDSLVLIHVALGCDLKGVGVDLPAPEPLGTSKLNTLGSYCRDVSQVIKQIFPFGAVLKTQSDIGYAVRDGGNAIRNRQTLRTFTILLIRMDEVSVAALESETAAEILEDPHNVHNGSINRVDIQSGQRCLPLLNVTRVIDEALWFRERFHLLCFLPQVG